MPAIDSSIYAKMCGHQSVKGLKQIIVNTIKTIITEMPGFVKITIEKYSKYGINKI